MNYGWNESCLKKVEKADCAFQYPSWQLSDAVIAGVLTTIRFHLPAVVAQYKSCAKEKNLFLDEKQIRLSKPQSINQPFVYFQFDRNDYKLTNGCEATYFITATIVCPFENDSDCVQIDLQNYANAFVRVLGYLRKNEREVWKFEKCHQAVGITIGDDVLLRKTNDDSISITFSVKAIEHG